MLAFTSHLTSLQHICQGREVSNKWQLLTMPNLKLTSNVTLGYIKHLQIPPARTISLHLLFQWPTCPWTYRGYFVHNPTRLVLQTVIQDAISRTHPTLAHLSSVTPHRHLATASRFEIHQKEEQAEMFTPAQQQASFNPPLSLPTPLHEEQTDISLRIPVLSKLCYQLWKSQRCFISDYQVHLRDLLFSDSATST